jgi:hypothetical protein
MMVAGFDATIPAFLNPTSANKKANTTAYSMLNVIEWHLLSFLSALSAYYNKDYTGDKNCRRDLLPGIYPISKHNRVCKKCV